MRNKDCASADDKNSIHFIKLQTVEVNYNLSLIRYRQHL